MKYVGCFAFTILSLVPGLAFAQGQRLQGTIEDDMGQPLMAGQIVIESASGAPSFTLSPGRDGKFLMLGLPPGAYKITIRATGFETETREMRVRLGFTEDIGRLRLHRVGDKAAVAERPQPRSLARTPGTATVEPGPGTVFVRLNIRGLARTTTDDYEWVEAQLRRHCITEHLLPLISQRGWAPTYLGVSKPPTGAKGLLTIDYAESQGPEYLPLGRGVGISFKVRLTEPVAGAVVWDEALSAATSPTVTLTFQRDLYTDALENLGKACRNFRLKVSTDFVVKPSLREKAQLPALSQPLAGSNEIRVRNPNDVGVLVQVRSGGSGTNFAVDANGVASIRVPDGSYDIYFIYSHEPEALYQGDSFTLSGNGIEIQVVSVVGGNYNIRRVK